MPATQVKLLSVGSNPALTDMFFIAVFLLYFKIPDIFEVQIVTNDMCQLNEIHQPNTRFKKATDGLSPDYQLQSYE